MRHRCVGAFLGLVYGGLLGIVVGVAAGVAATAAPSLEPRRVRRRAMAAAAVASVTVTVAVTILAARASRESAALTVPGLFAGCFIAVWQTAHAVDVLLPRSGHRRRPPPSRVC